MNKPIDWYGTYVRLGGLLYRLATPLRWLFLSHTHRGYAWVQHDSRVLLVKNWFGAGEWSLPGGGIHGWERAVDGVKRELREEVGIDNTELTFLGEGFKKERFGGKHYLLYFSDIDMQPAIRVKKREITSYTWLPLPTFVKTPGVSEEARLAFDQITHDDTV